MISKQPVRWGSQAYNVRKGSLPTYVRSSLKGNSSLGPRSISSLILASTLPCSDSVTYGVAGGGYATEDSVVVPWHSRSSAASAAL